jgi:DNA-binding transcriptional ArsR family regulator
MDIPHQVFSALGDPSRVEVLTTLARSGPATATELAAKMPITRQAVAKHLAALSAAGLVNREPLGREVRYQFDASPLEELASWASDATHTWDRRLERLRRSLE